MVINDLDVFGTRSGPSEAESPLVIDPDAVLALSVAAKCFEPVSGRHPQVLEAGGDFELPQLAASDRRNAFEPPDPFAASQRSGVGTPERPDHAG